jgi:DNA polymerase elongation subunit (family B)
MSVGRVTWTDYCIDDGLGVLVRLSARMKDGSRFNGYVQGTEPYIFAPDDESVPDEDYIQYTESGYESLFDHDLQKIVTDTPKQAGGLTDRFSWTGEGDVPYYRRVSIHDGLSGYIKLPDGRDSYGSFDLIHIDDIETDVEYGDVIHPRISIADIEVRVPEDESFDEMTENGSQPINVITSYDTYEEEYTVFFYDKYGGLDTDAIRPKIEEQLHGTNSMLDGEKISKYRKPDIELFIADSEVDMLKAYIDYVNERGFDLFSGWNAVDFDRKYIRRRMNALRDNGKDIHSSWLSPFDAISNSYNEHRKIVGRPPFDMLKAFCDKLSFSNWRSKSLEYVSNEELGIGKIDEVNINQDWKNEPSRLIAYNIIDSLLCVALDDKNDIHGFFFEMADVASIPITDVFYEKRQVDGLIMSVRPDDEVLPTTKESEEINNAGGYVADAANGRIENVGVSDLKSLYPSAMITWNLSTETLSDTPEDFDEYIKVPKVPEPKDVHGEILEEDINFDWMYASFDKEGILPRNVKRLFKKRNSEKKRMYEAENGSAEESKWNRKQGATKVLMNSIYGVSASPYWRLSNQFLGDAITSTARYTLWKGKQTLDRLGYEHVYSDTDSHMMKLSDESVEKQVEELKWVSSEMDSDASEILADCGYHDVHPFLKGSDLHGDAYTCMLWEAEKLGTHLQLGRKKRYAQAINWKEGTFYDEPNISISGFENARSDSPEITAVLQEEVIKKVLFGAGFDEVSEYIQSTIKQIDGNHPNVEKFALPGSINKNLEDYPNRQVPRACMWSNEHLEREFSEGDDPFVYLVKETPSDLPNTDVLALEWNEEIPDGFKLDREAIIERGIKKPIDTIVNEVGWEFNELRSGKKQQTMDFGGGNPFE